MISPKPSYGELRVTVGVLFRKGVKRTGGPKQMTGFIESQLAARRTLEKALADLVAEFKHNPSPNLARTIELLRAEVEARKQPD